MAFYQLNRALEGRQKMFYEIGGFLCILLIWWLLTLGAQPVIPKGILPAPGKIIDAFFEMLRENDLIPNFFYSLGLNLGGYIEAIVISVPLGFALGLIPRFRSAFIRPVDAARFLVLPAAVGLFIAWFGIGSWMKIHFLAFGIIIYLLPVAVQRIDEVDDVYLKTVYTLGANTWQMIKTVYFPSVISKLFSDIRILTAISWTYIVIAEAIGGEAGIGALTWRVGLRRGRIDKVFCLLIIIMLVGIFQDKLFGYLDKKFFPFKYQEQWARQKRNEKKDNLAHTIWSFFLNALSWTVLLAYVVLAFDEYFGLLGHYNLLSALFRDTIWVMHVIFLGLAYLKLRPLYTQWQLTQKSQGDG